MNYYLDFIPSEKFLDKLKSLKASLPEDVIIANVYLKSLPAMNPNESIYMTNQEADKYIKLLIKNKIKVNIMLNVFCYGNHEFSEDGKDILKKIDDVLTYKIYSVTATNHFFINYLRRRHKETKIIASEFGEIENIQKVARYIDNIGVDAVKVDFALGKNKAQMKNIINHYSPSQIHIDMNRLYFFNDIFRESFNNTISHYIHDGRWDDVRKYISIYKADQRKLGNRPRRFTKKNLLTNQELGYINFWFYYNLNESEDKYLEKFIALIK